MNDRAEPSVTVVIATRDRPALLRRAIGSVLLQRYPGPIEIIAVFDQSKPDHSLAGTRFGLSGPRHIRVITNERTPGLAGARNSGIIKADADLIAFCDDDDLWLPSKLTHQIAMLDAYPELEVVTAGVMVDAHGRCSTRVLDRDLITHEELLRNRVSEAHPSTYIFRSRALKNGIGLVDEHLPGGYAEDYDLLLRAARRHPIGAVQLPLAKIFWHRSSFFAERWRTIVDALDYLLIEHPEISTVPSGLARIEAQQAFALASMRDRKAAFRKAKLALGHNHFEPRAWLALVVAAGFAKSEWVLKALQSSGRGI